MKAIIMLIIALIAGISFHASSQDNGLDGKTFRIKLKMTDGERKFWQWTKDEISFEAGTLKSKVMTM